MIHTRVDDGWKRVVGERDPVSYSRRLRPKSAPFSIRGGARPRFFATSRSIAIRFRLRPREVEAMQSVVCEEIGRRRALGAQKREKRISGRDQKGTREEADGGEDEGETSEIGDPRDFSD